MAALSIRLNSSHGGGTPGDPTVVHESLHHPQTIPDGFSRPSSDEGENEEREDNADKLDCHYSGYHPRPVAVSTLTSLISDQSPFLFVTTVKLCRIIDFHFKKNCCVRLHSILQYCLIPKYGHHEPLSVPSTVHLEVDCLGEAFTPLTGDGTECDVL